MLPIVVPIPLLTISPQLAYLTAGLIILSPSIAGFCIIMGGLASSHRQRLSWLMLLLLCAFTSAIVISLNVYCFFTGLAFGLFLGLVTGFLTSPKA